MIQASAAQEALVRRDTIAQEMQQVVDLSMTARKILPTLEITTGIGMMEIPRKEVGEREMLTADFNLGSDRPGEMVIKNNKNGTATIFLRRGEKPSGGIFKSGTEIMMAATYDRSDLTALPKDLKMTLQFDGTNATEDVMMMFDIEGHLISARLDDEYVERGGYDKTKKQDLEYIRELVARKLGLSLTERNPLEGQLNIKATLSRFINDQELGKTEDQTDKPALIFKA